MDTAHTAHRAHTTPSTHTGERAPRRYGHRTHMLGQGNQGTGGDKRHPTGSDTLGRPSRPTGPAAGAPGPLVPARPGCVGDHGKRHPEPWQQPMAGAGTQPRRGSPAKQRDPATQATGLRRLYRRLAGAIAPVVRDTPQGWAAPQSRRPKEGACGPPYPRTLVGTPSHRGHLDRVAAILPFQAPAGPAKGAAFSRLRRARALALCALARCSLKLSLGRHLTPAVSPKVTLVPALALALSLAPSLSPSPTSAVTLLLFAFFLLQKSGRKFHKTSLRVTLCFQPHIQTLTTFLLKTTKMLFHL